MSEYTYYEFQTINRILSEDERNALRNISSRAVISSTKFTNYYNYGGLKANPKTLLENYFDVYYCTSNYSYQILGFKFPKDLLDVSKIQDYLVNNEIFYETEKYIILYFEVEIEDSYNSWMDEDSATNQLDNLLPIYQEIITGDYRSFYLYWLYIAEKNCYEEELEPPVCPGLKQLTNAQKEFCEFLKLDEDLLEVVSENSEFIHETIHQKENFHNWIMMLSEEEKNNALAELIIQDNQFYKYKILQKFEMETKKYNKENSYPSRTFQMLSNLAEEKRNIRIQKEIKAKEEKRIQEEALQKEQREKYLDQLATKENEIWMNIEKLIQKKVPKAYQDAKELLIDLRDLSVMQKRSSMFIEKLDNLKNQHNKKLSVVQMIKTIKSSL